MNVSRLAVGVTAVLGMLSAVSVGAQPARPEVAALQPVSGWDDVLTTLTSVFDGAEVLALGEAHGRPLDEQLRARLVRHPDFPAKARFVLLESARVSIQPVLDRYVAGESLSSDALEALPEEHRPMLSAMRDVNETLPPSRALRVLAALPEEASVDRDEFAVALLREHVLDAGERALVVFGSGHLWHGRPLTERLQAFIPGRVFVAEVLASAAFTERFTGPEVEVTFDALATLETLIETDERPVLLPTRGTAAGAVSAEPFFFGMAMLPEALTLSDSDDAVICFGRNEDGTVRYQ
jgi:hypothetical protein